MADAPKETESMQCLLQTFLAWNHVAVALRVWGCSHEKKYHVPFHSAWRIPAKRNMNMTDCTHFETA